MKIASLIAALGRNGQLGLGNKLPWNDPDDLRWFRDRTMGGIVIMGRRTREGITGRLVGRQMVVWDGKVAPQALIEHLAVEKKTIWIAGGAHTYRSFMPYVRHSIITHVEYTGPADVFMPPLWELAA